MCLSRRRRRGQCQEIFVPTLNRQIPASLGARIVSASELGNSGRADYADCRPRPNRQSPIATPRSANEEGSGSCSGASAVEPIVKPYHNSGVSVQEMELIEPMNCTTPLPSRPLTVLPTTVMACPPKFYVWPANDKGRRRIAEIEGYQYARRSQTPYRHYQVDNRRGEGDGVYSGVTAGQSNDVSHGGGRAGHCAADKRALGAPTCEAAVCRGRRRNKLPAIGNSDAIEGANG